MEREGKRTTRRGYAALKSVLKSEMISMGIQFGSVEEVE